MLHSADKPRDKRWGGGGGEAADQRHHRIALIKGTLSFRAPCNFHTRPGLYDLEVQ